MPRANLLYSPRNKILATSLLIEAFLYEEQTRRGVSIRHWQEFEDVADHCTVCHGEPVSGRHRFRECLDGDAQLLRSRVTASSTWDDCVDVLSERDEWTTIKLTKKFKAT